MKGATAAAWVAGNRASAAALGRSQRKGATKLHLDRKLAVEQHQGMRSPPGHTGDGIKARGAMRGGGGDTGVADVAGAQRPDS